MINTTIRIERFNLFSIYGACGLMAALKSQINCFQNPRHSIHTYSINTIHREKYRQVIDDII